MPRLEPLPPEAIEDLLPSLEATKNRMGFLPNSQQPLDRLAARFFHWSLNRALIAAVEDGRLRFPLGLGGSVPAVRGTHEAWRYTLRNLLDRVFGRSLPH